MRRLTYQNSLGYRIVFHLSPFLIESLTGISEVDATLQSQSSPYQDGDTYIDTTLQPRFPVLEGSITETDLRAIQKHRNEILKVCNPKYGLGMLTLEQNGEVKRTYGALDGVPVFPDKRESPFQKFMITWKCPNPYWQDINPISLKLEDYVPNFKFPFKFPVKFSTRGDSRLIVNEGHVATPITVTFRGEAVNPQITNETTGQFIKINRTIPEGYELRITTDFNNKSAKIIDINGVESNALGYLDLNSEFFMLQVGNNNLSFVAEGGRPEVYVEYRHWYVGI